MLIILSNSVPLVTLSTLFPINVPILSWRHGSHKMAKQSGSAWLVCVFLIGWLINRQDRVCLPTCTIQASRTVIVKAVPVAAAIYIPSMHLINCFATFALLDLLQAETLAFRVSVLEFRSGAFAWL